MLLEKPGVKSAPKTAEHAEDEPLPATLTFVLGIGISFTLLWFAMYVLLRSRW